MPPGIALGINMIEARKSVGGAPALPSLDGSTLTAGAATLPAGWTLTRASAATVQTGTSTVVTSGIGTDQARAGRRLDADPIALVIEEARTNLAADGRDTSAASWSAASGTAETRPSGTAPDGSAITATRTVGTGYGRYVTLTGTLTDKRALSMWRQVTSGGAAAARRQFGTANTDDTCAVAWERVSDLYTIAATFYLNPCNAGLGGGQDVRHDLHQCEVGSFCTEYIHTSGGTATRAGERLTCTADLRDAGRVSLAFALQPKGASTQYTADLSLWYLDASNRAYVNFSTRVVTMVVGGVSYSTAVAMTWAANDVVDIYVAAGGGIASEASYRVNGGAKTVLSTGTPTALGSLGAGALDVLCAGTSNQFTAWVRSITAYRSGQRPAWAT